MMLHLMKGMLLMKLNELQAIYPEGLIKTTKEPDDSTLILPVENKWFYLPKETLTKSERKLLRNLFPETNYLNKLKDHPWYQYLFQNKPFPTAEQPYRIIQLKIKKESPNAMEWLTHFSELFNQVEDFFFIDKTTAILVEEKSPVVYQKTDLDGMILTLESEFLIQAHAFLGSFNEINQNFSLYFAEEQKIFHAYYKHQKNVFTFQDIAIDYLTKDKITKSSIMQTLKDTLNMDDELKLIIKTLWLKQGNITSTSKELYIHRNTLQYRLEKFYERTGFSLKDMNDLTLCYLLIN
ncbi:Fis family transcriptional regulator [Vagococcus hydrophili]|uniref:Fis family transcriptional regulator n=2 Tax=Vagococcus hydrophili TaxID=2714947 RepID=A0A6G8AV05_9ENTE|nr:Fis family transcriptional regulator [Vagococcus hydrophili]